MSFLVDLMDFATLATEPKKRRILVVDDEPGIRTTLSAILEIKGFEIETACSAQEAAQKIDAQVFDLIITDMRMETELAGCDVIRSARRNPYRPAVVILSAFPPGMDEYGVQAIFAKGNNVVELVETVEGILRQASGSSSGS